MHESKACTEFAVMMAQYAMEQQIKTFGYTLQHQYTDAQSECQRYGCNHSIFDQLPPTFTIDDLAALKRDGMARNSLLKITSRWTRDGWIKKVDDTHWKKASESDNDNNDNDNKEV